MKRINLQIKVCPECPYYDGGYIDVGYLPWCHKSERELSKSFNPPEWCVLEECYVEN